MIYSICNNINTIIMFLDLPFDVQDLIYKRLNPSSRIKMKLVSKKTQYSKKPISHTKKLLVVEKYINRNKEKLNKNKKIPLNIQNFLISSAKDDMYARSLCEQIGIHIKDEGKFDDIYPSNLYQSLIMDITRNNITEKRMKELYVNITEEDFKDSDDFLRTVSKSCNKNTYLLLQKNEIINNHLKIPNASLVENFIFSMINNRNDSLLELLTTPDYNEYFNITIAKNYICSSKIASIFADSFGGISLILKYFPDISHEILIEIRNTAEEYLNADVVFLVSTYIKDS